MIYIFYILIVYIIDSKCMSYMVYNVHWHIQQSLILINSSVVIEMSIYVYVSFFIYLVDYTN